MPSEFDDRGCLAPGTYTLSFPELRNSILVQGPAHGYPDWDREWRSKLVDGAEVLVRQLWQCGVENVFLAGSFVEDKDHPNDIDGYFEIDGRDELSSGRLVTALNLLDPHKVWTWDPRSRRRYRGYSKLQLPMWLCYRVELFPHFPGLSSGILDEHGNELEFPAAFRRSRRDKQPRGIIRMTTKGDSNHDPQRE